MRDIRTQQTACPDLCHVQQDYLTKTYLMLELRRKKMSESRTTLRNNSKGLKRCRMYMQEH